MRDTEWYRVVARHTLPWYIRLDRGDYYGCITIFKEVSQQYIQHFLLPSWTGYNLLQLQLGDCAIASDSRTCEPERVPTEL